MLLFLKKTACGVQTRQAVSLLFSDNNQICYCNLAPWSVLFSLACNLPSKIKIQSSLQTCSLCSPQSICVCLSYILHYFFFFFWVCRGFGLELLSWGTFTDLRFWKTFSASVVTAFVRFLPLSCRQRWASWTWPTGSRWSWRPRRSRLCSQGTRQLHSMGGSPWPRPSQSDIGWVRPLRTPPRAESEDDICGVQSH